MYALLRLSHEEFSKALEMAQKRAVSLWNVYFGVSPQL
jgi:predicted transcriptional regulator